MGVPPFSAPCMYWVGMNLRDAAPGEIEDNGFSRLHRYEVLERDPRHDLVPTWLALYEADEEAARRYLALEDGPPEQKPKYSSGPPIWEERTLVWRMIWGRIPATETTGAAAPDPDSVFLVGMEPAEGDAGALEEFNAFYTGTHVAEVVAAGSYRRGSRYELRRGLLHPGGASPRYCAIYEGDPPVTEAVRSGSVHPTIPDPARNLSAGPPVWAERTTVWRAVYRSLGTILGA